MIRKILVALDESELAESILPHVCECAKISGAELILLRVSEDPMRDFELADTMITEQRTNAQVIHFERKGYLEGVAEKLRAEGLRVTTEVVPGAVAETILAEAERTQADMIALSTHGRGGLARLLMGSVASQVVHGAHVPVLLIRPPAPPAQASTAQASPAQAPHGG